MAAAQDPQLALAVDRPVHLTVHEQRGQDVRELRVGPLGEPDARVLAALLLSRVDVPVGEDGPWRAAIAGGARTVRIEA